jgi:Domain of unknown function (DUF2024)
MKMRVDVYDTYATSQSGGTIHFDVLLPSPSEASMAYEYALKWLADIGQKDARLSQTRCTYCHSESASAAVIADIQSSGFHILQMEGCPNPR